jgi:hypothetical protein
LDCWLAAILFAVPAEGYRALDCMNMRPQLKEVSGHAVAEPYHFECSSFVVGYGPTTLCPEGGWSHEELRAALPDFAALYSQRPICRNVFGVNTNGAFSLFFTLRALRPTHVIHSGVLHGQTVWLARAVLGPNVKMIVLDPRDESSMIYLDYPSTVYYTGHKFIDFADMDWHNIVPEQYLESTLIILDDHMACTRRVEEIRKFGFRHIWFDDNMNYLYGADKEQTHYSCNMGCAPVPAGVDQVVFADHFGTTFTNITLH